MKQNLDYPGCKAKNHWCCVDAHSQNGAITVLRSLLHIKAANTSVMHNMDQITVQFPYLREQRFLTLHWRSVDAQFNVLSFHHLLPLIVVFIMIWSYWLSFWQIQKQLCVVLPTVADCQYRSGSGSKPNCCYRGGFGCQQTQPVNLGRVR